MNVLSSGFVSLLIPHNEYDSIQGVLSIAPNAMHHTSPIRFIITVENTHPTATAKYIVAID